MGNLFRDSGHLIRPALVLLAGLGVFMVVRQAVIPKAFGQYGHYRPGAIDLVRRHPITYAGQQQCAMCHEDQAKVRAEGRHAHVACETCHGPQAKHAEDGSNLPKLPEVATLCVRCHEKDAAKPPKFPQVASAEHSGGMACNDCHKPHNPHL
ncbi:MAG TPA: multiheme c-type cytochrome [Candidatus Acidoferrales bacterium]|nr:multiheme c-type cytochrome [Candidatus Acidoferrales bacterium]